MALLTFFERFDDALEWDVHDPFLSDDLPLAPADPDHDDPLFAVDVA